MGFVYHGVPRDLVGTVIYPLNQLAAVDPAAHERHAAKYAWREQLREYRIPVLDVLWNDVVHCAPIHPFRLFNAWKEAGLEMLTRPEPLRVSGLFFQIPLERILIHPVAWFAAKERLGARDGQFESFDPSRYRELSSVGEAYRAYLREAKEGAEPPLLFHRIPHVLVAGPIDVGDLPVIACDVAPPPR